MSIMHTERTRILPLFEKVMRSMNQMGLVWIASGYAGVCDKEPADMLVPIASEARIMTMDKRGILRFILELF